MREFSAEGEVVAVKRAMRLIRARRTSDEAYDVAQDELLDELNALEPAKLAAAMWDLIHALVRYGSTSTAIAAVRSSGVFDDEATMEMIEGSLMGSSIEHDPDEPT